MYLSISAPHHEEPCVNPYAPFKKINALCLVIHVYRFTMRPTVLSIHGQGWQSVNWHYGSKHLSSLLIWHQKVSVFVGYAEFQNFQLSLINKVHKRHENCLFESPWNTALPPAGLSAPSAGCSPPASPWNTTNNLSVAAPGQFPIKPKLYPQIRYDEWGSPQQFRTTVTTKTQMHRGFNVKHASCSLCRYVRLTCAAPGSASPGPASGPAGGWPPVWAVSLTSGAPTPAGSASSDHSGSDCACGSLAPDASSGSSPAATQKHTEAFSVVAKQSKGSRLQLMIIFIMVRVRNRTIA